MINEGGCSHMMLVKDGKLHGLLFGVALQPAIPKLLCTYVPIQRAMLKSTVSCSYLAIATG